MLSGLKEMPRPRAMVWVSQWNGSIAGLWRLASALGGAVGFHRPNSMPVHLAGAEAVAAGQYLHARR